MQVDPSIFKAYDIRGIVGRTLHEEDAYALGRTFAAEAHDAGARRLAVGRDGREHSPRLEEALVRGLTEGGMDVVRVGQGPSPMLYWAVAELDVDGGIQITGSHNPANYNGFKMVFQGRPFFGEDIQSLGRMAAEGDWDDGAGGVEQVEVMDAYLDRLATAIDGIYPYLLEPLRIGWDAGNGAAGPALEKLVARLPGEQRVDGGRRGG